MSDYRQDPTFRAFVAGFCISREGFNGECDYDHQAPASFGEDLPGDGSFEAAIEYCSKSEEFMRLYGEYVAYKMGEGVMSEFINANESLPLVDEMVIAWTVSPPPFGEGCEMAAFTYELEPPGWINAIGDAVDVTHWMPLPAPPR